MDLEQKTIKILSIKIMYHCTIACQLLTLVKGE